MYDGIGTYFIMMEFICVHWNKLNGVQVKFFFESLKYSHFKYYNQPIAHGETT